MLLVSTHEDLARKALGLLGGILSRVLRRDTVRGFQLAWIVWCFVAHDSGTYGLCGLRGNQMVDKLQRSRHASFLLQIGSGKEFVSRFLVSGSLQHEGRKLPPATARQVKPERTTEPRCPGSKGAGSAAY